MYSTREIVTLQFGSYSNFVGAHWWNIQESGFQYHGSGVQSDINHDVLYREGLTTSGLQTYTPRLLLVDLKGSLKRLPKEGDLYGRPPRPFETSALWAEEKVEILEEEQLGQNAFIQQLESNAPGDLQPVNNVEENIETWTDYLISRYHPDSTHIINEYQYGSTDKPFDVFTEGVTLWNTQEFKDDFVDSIRKLVESCDNMQGFHVLLDATDGFAGLGSSAILHLEDEYPSKCVLAFSNIPAGYSASTPVADGIRTINMSLLFPKLADHCSLFVPLSLASLGWRQPGPPREFPHLQFKEMLMYHTGAILAAALDTVTLSYRLRADGTARVFDVCGNLSRVGRKAAAASLGLPFPMAEGSFLLETLEKWEGPLWQSLTPNCSLNEDRIWLQSLVVRGIPLQKLRCPDRNYRDYNPAYSCTTVQEMISLFLSYCSYATASHVTTADSPLKVVRPFPDIFSQNILTSGAVSQGERPPHTGVLSVPAIAGLHSSRSVGDMLESLHTQVAKLNLRSFHQFADSGLEKDEYSANLENLLELRDCYHEEFNV